MSAVDASRPAPRFLFRIVSLAIAGSNFLKSEFNSPPCQGGGRERVEAWMCSEPLFRSPGFVEKAGTSPSTRLRFLIQIEQTSQIRETSPARAALIRRHLSI